jgi:hypothetical protein
MSDGVRLPDCATKVSSYGSPAGDDDDDSWGDESDEEDPGSTFSFPELTEQIQSAIEALGGEVIPKLNWSSPKDATWVNSGSLKCQTAGDVYVLLKSSDFVMHDVLHAFDNTMGEKPNMDASFELVLRQWCNLNPSMEFRCFVWNGDLLAISQRNHTQHFPHMTTEKLMFRSQILDFFDEFIHENFQSSLSGTANYCFDVYIDKQERLWLLDFNVWGTQTDALLFTWGDIVRMSDEVDESDEEVILLSNRRPEIRVVETANEIHHDPLASYRAPIDTVDLATMTGPDASKFQDFMAMCRKPSEGEEDN